MNQDIANIVAIVLVCGTFYLMYFIPSYFYKKTNLYKRQQEKKAAELKAKEMLCTTCGSQGIPSRAVRGSFLVEIILWLFFLLPGIIYTLWRLNSRSLLCPKCHNSTMIPVDSPIAQKILNNQDN